jgi:hypothetical protein
MTLVAQNATTFDGTWSVTMSARNYQNPNGTMSLAYAWHFSTTVKNGILHGERGNRGMGDFYEINGTIAADGTALYAPTVLLEKARSSPKAIALRGSLLAMQ